MTRIKYYRRGTNQYKTRSKTERFNWILLAIYLALFAALIIGAAVQKSMQPVHFLSPLGQSFDFTRGEVYAEDRIAGQSAQVTVPTLNPDVSEREQNIELIHRIWGADAAIGLAIAKCESGYRTHAKNINTNNTVDQGVFQVNSVHGMPEMDVATANISYAYTIYLKQGTTPWDSSAHCWNQ